MSKTITLLESPSQIIIQTHTSVLDAVSRNGTSVRNIRVTRHFLRPVMLREDRPIY